MLGPGDRSGGAMGIQQAIRRSAFRAESVALLLRGAFRNRRTLALLGAIGSLLLPVGAQIGPSPSTNISTQQLTLTPQNPVAPITVFNINPSVPGSTNYYYWTVSHDSLGDTAAPVGPFIAGLTFVPSAAHPVALAWTVPSGVASVDVLRTTSNAVPTGACACAVVTATSAAIFSDTVSTTSAYSVATSASEQNLVLTNLTAAGGTTSLPLGNAVQAEAFGVVHKVQILYAASISNGSNQLSSGANDPPFQPSDVGSILFCTNLALGNPRGELISTVTVPQTTIASFVNSHQVNLTGTASNAGSTICAWGPTDDTTAWTNAWNAAVFGSTGNGQCSTLTVGAGYSFVSAATFNAVGNCAVNVDVSGGLGLQGVSETSSVIIPLPNFNHSSCTNGADSVGCFFGQNATLTIQQIGFWGLGQSAAGNATETFFEFGGTYTTLRKVAFIGWGGGKASNSNDCVKFNQIEQSALLMHIDGCGGVSVDVNSGTTSNPVSIASSPIGNSTEEVIRIENSSWLASTGNTIGGNNAASCIICIVGTNALWRSANDSSNVPASNGASSTFLQLTGTGSQASVALGDLSDTATTANGINAGTGTTVILSDTKVFATTDFELGGGTIINRGGNSFSGTYAGTGPFLAQYPGEVGHVNCVTSSATITFQGTYTNTPFVLTTDVTTAGLVTQSGQSNTGITLGCPGATDSINYSVFPLRY